ncbi:hypothetical protein D3C76_1372380 [compost metagenome]
MKHVYKGILFRPRVAHELLERMFHMTYTSKTFITNVSKLKNVWKYHILFLHIKEARMSADPN